MKILIYISRCVCGEKYQKNCITYSEDKPVCKTILKPKCETRYRKKCVSNSRDIEEPYDTEECNSKEVEICDKIWIDKGNGVKEWADDPDTCQTLTKTVCHTVTKFRKVKDALQTIEEESYEHCQNVEENFCQIIKVEKEQCENEAVTVCVSTIIILTNVNDPRFNPVFLKSLLKQFFYIIHRNALKSPMKIVKQFTNWFHIKFHAKKQ